MKDTVSKFIAVSLALVVVLTFFFIGGFGALSSYIPFTADSKAIVGEGRGAEWAGAESKDLGVTDDTRPAVAQAVATLAARLSTDIQNISPSVVKSENWNDACLGLPAGGEMCAQVVTPGYLIILNVGGRGYAYRSNSDGSVLRFETEGPVEASL